MKQLQCKNILEKYLCVILRVASSKAFVNKKFQLMLTRRANYLQPFRRSSFLGCALQPKIAKINKTPYFGSSESFKVIDVDRTEKLVTGACCDKQHAHV